MKFKSILLTAVAGACLALPSLGDPATRLIKNESTEASTGLAMSEGVVKNLKSFNTSLLMKKIIQQIITNTMGKILIKDFHLKENIARLII